MRILLIGNSGLIAKLSDGQTAKLRLYKKKMIDEGCEVVHIDLERFSRRPLSILRNIKKQIKLCDRIVLVSGERACRLLIPFINKKNKKTKRPFILPLIGAGVLHFSIDHLSDYDKNRFLVNGEYELGKKNKKIARELKKIDYILPETELIRKVYSEFYGLSNCVILNNFREQLDDNFNSDKNNNAFKMIYLSRVNEIKGILDLVSCLNKIDLDYQLDIYGAVSLKPEQQVVFDNCLSEKIRYCGVINSDEAVKTINNYDLFVFPTRYFGEGTPGVIAESLIAGTPVLSSNFPQAKYLLKDGYDSILFKMFDPDDLKEKLIYCIGNKELLNDMRKNALESGKKYLYKHEREKFLKYVCGVEEE